MQKRNSSSDDLFIKAINFAVEGNAPFLPKKEELAPFIPAFGDEALVKCCFTLIENDLNVTRTAKALYMHRNTLIYRLKKLKDETGLDVSTFYGAVRFAIFYKAYVGEQAHEKQK